MSARAKRIATSPVIARRRPAWAVIAPRWRKVLRDLWLHRSRSILVVLAIAAGIAGAGSILNTWALVGVATREGFRASNPASATLRTDSIDAALMERVRALPAIRDVQARRTLVASVQTSGAWRTAMMFAVDDFTAIRIGLVKPEVGAWPPEDGTFVIERSSVAFSGAAVSESLKVAIRDAVPQALHVTGIARDVGLAPGWMEHVVYGFVTRGTLARLGAPSTLNELQIVVREPGLDQEAVRRIAYDVKAVLEGAGHPVSDVDVPVPGEHIHAPQMDSLLYTQLAFAVLALLLSGFLVVNLIGAMLAGQVREIGVMKTLGARPGQIAAMYLGLALVLGLVAAGLGLPVAVVIGRRYAQLKAELLNFPLDGFSIPLEVLVLQFAVGALLPVAAAGLPVGYGCRISVSQALRDFGIRGDTPMSGRWLSRVGGVSRPVLLSLRNAFRRRQRMVLTLMTLALGGAVFLGARNLRVAIRGVVDLLYEPQRFDFVLRFAEPHLPDSVEAAVGRVSGVAAAEAWAGARAGVSHADGILGNTFALTAPPAGTRMLVPNMVDGRWLRAGDARALVVGQSLFRQEPGLRVGERTTLVVGGRPTEWTVVGRADAGPAPLAYAPREAVLEVSGTPGVSTVVVASDLSGIASQVELIQRLRGELERHGMPVGNSQLLAENRRVMEDHLLMVGEFLGVMAWVIILVGGLGLASTMSLAVLERTREIGVLRAIGARHRAILTMVQVEGLVIAVLSWAIAVPLSVPMSVILGKAFGRVMLPVPTIWVPEASGVAAWLGLVVVVSLLACGWPAVRATRIPTAAALAYE